LVTLDLAANGLGSTHASIIAKIISDRQQKNDERKWQQSFRKLSTHTSLKV